MRRRSGEGKLREDCPLQQQTMGFRLTIEWQVKPRSNADLDLLALLYSDMGKCFEKVNADNPVSSDGAITLQTDIAREEVGKSLSNDENIHVDLKILSRRTAAILLYVNGGTRNFNVVENIVLHCSQENVESNGRLSLLQQLQSKTDGGDMHLFSCDLGGCQNMDMEGLVAVAVYKYGFHEDGTTQWACRPLFEPVYELSMNDKIDYCCQLALNQVPTFRKFRSRIFGSVKAICSALSSTALPRLKKSFTTSPRGLKLEDFTKELFSQLYEVKPRLLEPSEASYTVALLHDMFGQIDFNGDGCVDWEEFTSFCIHTGLAQNDGLGGGPTNLELLSQYSIQYHENMDVVDKTLTGYLNLPMVRHVADNKRILAIEADKNEIIVMNEQFNHLSTVNPQVLNRRHRSERMEQIQVYDMCYIPFRDLYAYTSSDHTIVVFREHSTMGGKRLYYSAYNRMYHQQLHLKLCWSDKSRLLCTVDSENILYGWTLDGKTPIFQLSRHKDLVTDFISIDEHSLFATCSLDKRIVLWSQKSRRVKAVLLGHKRGVRCLSHVKDTLLSAGFECEAKTWDMTTKEPAMILRGHRHPICCAKLMHRPDAAGAADRIRAVTVDDSGEFRLWNVHVKEKSSELGYAEVLQTFVGQDASKTAKISFIFFPFNDKYSAGNYSNIIAASSKLLHFKPDKIKKEFTSPSSMVFSNRNAAILTAVGKSVFKYDVVNGGFHCEFSGFDSGDICSMCVDCQYGRRVYIGASNGQIMVVNISTGQVLSKNPVHSKEVTCISVMADKLGKSIVFSASADGGVKSLNEADGVLAVHSSLDNALGENAPINSLKAYPERCLLLGASTTRTWGIWNTPSLKRIVSSMETDNISDVEVVIPPDGATYLNGLLSDYTDSLVSVAVCLASCVKVYCVDYSHMLIEHTHTLEPPEKLYFSRIISVCYPTFNSVNYGATHDPVLLNLGEVLVASSDEGKLVVWDVCGVAAECVDKFFSRQPDILNSTELAFPYRTSQELMKFRKKWIDDMKLVKKSRLLSNSDAPQPSDGVVTMPSPVLSEGTDECSLLASRVSSPTKRTLSVSSRDVDLSVISISSSLCWSGHNDLIQSLVALTEHHCFATVSLDGYHRIWNLQKQCIGELPLPNITETESKVVEGPVEWRFVMEKVPVTTEHCNIAATLSNIVHKDALNRRASGYNPARRREASMAVKPLEQKKYHLDSNGASARQDIIKHVFSPYSPSDDFNLEGDTVASTASPTLTHRSAGSTSSPSLVSRPHTTASLTRVPGCKNDKNWNDIHDLQSSNSHAFSDASINASQSQGLIDKEAHSILQKLNSDKCRVSVFDRSQPTVRLRNVSKATRVDYPSSNTDGAEVSFGYQKNMYKNASKIINDHVKSHPWRMATARENIAMNRINTNVQRIGSMLQVSEAAGHVDTALPPLLSGKEAGEEVHEPQPLPLQALHRSRSLGLRRQATVGLLALSGENRKTLDRERIANMMQRIADAGDESMPEWERRLEKLSVGKKRASQKRREDASNKHHESVLMLERRLKHAIMGAHQMAESDMEEIRKGLTTRDLLPFYQLEDLRNFLEIFLQVDDDYSGDLDVEEWLIFFSVFNKTVTKHQARVLFSKMDQDGDGYLSIRDLIPILFSKASKEQVDLISKHLESEVSSRKKSGRKYMTSDDMAAMFAFYDTDHIGFVSVKKIKDRLRSFRLPDQAHVAIFAVFLEYEDDEMISLREFTQLFAPYVLVKSKSTAK